MGNAALPVFGELHAWQLVFLVLAVPDLVLGLLLLTTMHEPVRRGRTMDSAGSAAPSEPDCYLWTHRAAFGPMFGGLALNSLALGTLPWVAPFFERTHGWSPAQYGIIFGFVYLLIAPLGLTFGGLLAQRWAKQGRDDANLRVVAVAALLHMPFANCIR